MHHIPIIQKIQKKRLMQNTKRKSLLLLLISGLFAFSMTTGCVYRSSIIQGSQLDQRAIDRLEVGMTRDQVRALLGTPLVQDKFHPDRWDYIFYSKNLPSSKETERLTIYFDGSKISKIDEYGR